MTVFRIAKKNYAEDLSGEGAKIYGGRWNNKGIPCVYSAESRALAMLEYTANIDVDFLPSDLYLTTIEVPSRSIFKIDINRLPADWKSSPSPSSLKEIGSLILADLKFAIVKVPSVIMEEEFNYILNPLHPSSGAFKVIGSRPIKIDRRLLRAG
jgi:RES domain-containing protein